MKSTAVMTILLLLFLAPTLVDGGEAKACPKCGTAVKADWNICPVCGDDLVKEGAAACKQCGYPLEGKWEFCPLCGSSRSEQKKVEKPSEKIIWDFEKPGKISEWRLKHNMKAGQATEHATSGKHSVRLDWPKGGGPSFRYEGPIEELSAWRYLKFDAFNPGDKPVSINVKLKSSGHHKQSTLNFVIPPKEERTISVRLDALAKKIDLSDVSYFNIFAWEPRDPGTLFVDAIRLTNE